MWKIRAILNDPKKMLPKHTHLWEWKVNEETSLYEHSNESIEINTLNTNDDMKNHLLSYDVLILEVTSIMYELNVMELYNEHR